MNITEKLQLPIISTNQKMKIYFFRVSLLCQLVFCTHTLSGQVSTTTLVNPDLSQPTNMFGFDIKLSADGSTLIAGAPYQTGPEGKEGLGMVCVYRRTMPFDPDHWEQIGQSLSINATGRFGSAVAISYDGNRIVVGAPNHLKGELRVYEYNIVSNIWGLIPSTDLSTIGSPRSDIGLAVAMSDDGQIVVVGSPRSESPSGFDRHGAVDILKYESETDGYIHSQMLFPTFDPSYHHDHHYGTSVNITGDGSSIVVGSPGYSGGKGRIYVYKNVLNSYDIAGVKTGGSGQRYIGKRVDIEKVGEDVFVVDGNSGSAGVQIYHVSQAFWALLPPYNLGIGAPDPVKGVAINSNGTIAVGTGGILDGAQGRVQWYKMKGNDWLHYGTIVPYLTGKNLGLSVSLSNKSSTSDLFIAGGAPGTFTMDKTGIRHVRIVRETDESILSSVSRVKSQKEIYPNPTHKYLNIRHTEEGDRIVLLDDKGNETFAIEVKKGQSEVSIDLERLEKKPGAYYIKISHAKGKQCTTERVVIER